MRSTDQSDKPYQKIDVKTWSEQASCDTYSLTVSMYYR